MILSLTVKLEPFGILHHSYPLYKKACQSYSPTKIHIMIQKTC